MKIHKYSPRDPNLLACPQCSLRSNLQHLATPPLVLSSLGATCFFKGESLWANHQAALGGELGSLSWMLARSFKGLRFSRPWWSTVAERGRGYTCPPLKINKCTLKRDHFKRTCHLNQSSIFRDIS